MGHLLQLHQTHLRLTLLLYQVGFHHHHHICPKSTLERCWQATYIEEEHASREKKCTMVILLIFMHKNVHRIGFQEIKIRP